MLYNLYRPKRFEDVVGQESEVALIKAILEKGWHPAALMISGGYGTGKTTLARLTARAMLCGGREGVEPCGGCDSCRAMDTDSHPAYTEIDSASHGLVDDIRGVKEDASYRVVGGAMRIVVYDESHMISGAGQDALLQILEEGREGVMFMFCTTDPEKMKPTIRSRCVDLNLKLLKADEIFKSLQMVAEKEKVEVEGKALRIIATYVRGHVRDALVLMEQIIKMTGAVKEDAVRAHLRLDRLVDVYEVLVQKEKKEILGRLESLLCSYSVGELTENIAQVMIDSYKMHIGVGERTQLDQAWMLRILEATSPETMLEKAQKLLELDSDFASVNFGVAALSRILFGELEEEKSLTKSLTPGTGAATIAPQFRKPAKVT